MPFVDFAYWWVFRRGFWGLLGREENSFLAMRHQSKITSVDVGCDLWKSPPSPPPPYAKIEESVWLGTSFIGNSYIRVKPRIINRIFIVFTD